MKREEWNRNWERLSPDEAAKKRMQERLLQAAAAQSAPKKQKPWLTIWKRPLQVGTFAAVCAALAILVQQQGLLEVRQQQQTMLESAAEQTTQTTTAAQEQQAASNPTAESSKQTQPASMHTQAAASTVGLVGGSGTTQTEGRTESSRQQTELPIHTGIASAPASSGTTAVAPPIQTAPPVVSTVAPAATTVQPQETQQETVCTTKTTTPVWNKDIHDFNRLHFQGTEYVTQYEEVPMGDIVSYLGSSVAMDAQSQEWYTVVIYAVKEKDAAQYLAVQYAGQDTYYLFETVE